MPEKTVRDAMKFASGKKKPLPSLGHAEGLSRATAASWREGQPESMLEKFTQEEIDDFFKRPEYYKRLQELRRQRKIPHISPPFRD